MTIDDKFRLNQEISNKRYSIVIDSTTEGIRSVLRIRRYHCNVVITTEGENRGRPRIYNCFK